jgi:uncharacterized protein (TIGR02600 family)
MSLRNNVRDPTNPLKKSSVILSLSKDQPPKEGCENLRMLILRQAQDDGVFKRKLQGTSIRRPRGKSGVALVMTVIALAVIMLLLLAFFSGAKHQNLAAQSEASLAREKMLADSATALVIGQITQASTQTGQAWMSQPGLLRAYDTTASRKPVTCYKLYSTASLAAMVDASGTLGFLASDVPADWSTRPNEYTDLNAPALTTTGTLTQSIYPILDPAALTSVPGISSDSGHNVEMPVAWLYELQDGTLGPASNGTAANPIMARIAFWADDDTSKININTAGVGSPWNTPRVNSTDDVAWSTTQPAVGEFSAYPGHSAMTSLAAIFSGLTPQQLLGLTPRYAWGGSQFGAVATTAGETVPVKADRLYASLDELAFSSTANASGQRLANPITATQINAARFVLTAHSQSPETTLLGEPRIAIWPIADATSTAAPRITAADRAIASAATVGTRAYYFQQHNAQSATDDLNASIVPSNAQLFGDLLTRGGETFPGYGAAFTTAKYPGAAWTQLMLEVTDYIRGVNAVDPSAAPFASYAAGDSTGVGRAFVIPLTTTYGTGANQATCRGLGRCPTLSSLTLVFYVCGFGFKDGTLIDYDVTPDDANGTSWKTNFAVGSTTSKWKQVTSELVRAFVVPCTFQPGCAYPEGSDACDIEIDGLNGIKVSSGTSSGDFGFAATANSRLLSDALTVLPADRAWGGNEGPAAWRAAALDGTFPFAGTKPFAVPLATGAVVDTLTNGPSLPASWARVITFNGVNGITVKIRDRNANTLQTLSLNFPTFSIHAPTINGECDHADGSTPATAHTDWTTNTTCAVLPSWYMNLRDRLLTTQNSRAAFLQAGDISRSIEANTDLRVIAGLASVPATLFHPHPFYLLTTTNAQGGSHAHNIRFADGTSACFAPGNNSPINNASSANTRLVSLAAYPVTTATIPVKDWLTGALLTPDTGTSITAYTYFTSPPCSVPTGTSFVSMSSGVLGDWDTGPGFSPDGAQINLPDSGTTLSPATAYFSLASGSIGAATQRAPNALLPSPVVFGSLPSGINPATPASSIPWRTLLFCPYPAANPSGAPYTTHPGAATPPDHLVLDNFWMPVVEPYPISTCMATAGKINLNDQIAPFTYLHRSTALRALLDDLRIPAIAESQANVYKSTGTAMASIWNKVDEAATIAQIENRFANGSVDAYLSESEICTVPLVPQGPAGTDVPSTQSALATFWSTGGGQLTGDNLRELPYAQLYGRLTTKSNSYTVHIRVQVLKKLTHDPNQNVWNEGTDLIIGDWRGSYEIERYLDPAATAPVAGSPLGPYKFRIVSARQFAP